MTANVTIKNGCGYKLWATVTDEPMKPDLDKLSYLGFDSESGFRLKKVENKPTLAYVNLFYQLSFRADNLMPIASQRAFVVQSNMDSLDLVVTESCTIRDYGGFLRHRPKACFRNDSDVPIWIAYDMSWKCLVTAAEELRKTKNKQEQIFMAQKHDFTKIMPKKDFECYPYGINSFVFVSVFAERDESLQCLVFVQEYEKYKTIIVNDGEVTQ